MSEFSFTSSPSVKKRIRVLIIAHFAEVWMSYDGLVRAMLASDTFEPIVISVDCSFDGAPASKGERHNHEVLEKYGIPHFRWLQPTHAMADEIIRWLKPDYIFQQTPWENSVPDTIHYNKFPHAKLCYIPYNLYIADTPEVLVNRKPLHVCWRIFCINQDMQDYFRTHSVKPDNTVVTGHPKIDYIRRYREQPGDWPIKAAEGKKKLRVLWAPHHSFTDDWLGYGTFPHSYPAMLEWAKTDPNVEIVMRPHHIMFSRALASGLMTPTQLAIFRAAWHALPNTAMDPHPDCSPVFAAADILLTDGVSFIAEFQVTGKPLVLLQSNLKRAPLTPFGGRFAECAYKMNSMEEAVAFLKEFNTTRADPHLADRQKAIAEKILIDGKSVERILDELEKGMQP